MIFTSFKNNLFPYIIYFNLIFGNLGKRNFSRNELVYGPCYSWHILVPDHQSVHDRNSCFKLRYAAVREKSKCNGIWLNTGTVSSNENRYLGLWHRDDITIWLKVQVIKFHIWMKFSTLLFISIINQIIW